MTTMPMLTVDHSAPQLTGVTTEVFTVSGLLSMPAVWTAVVDRELPVQVLLERFLIVLLTCALLAELVRRLGEGGALSHALSAGQDPTAPEDTAARTSRSAAPASSALFDDVDQSDLGGFDDTDPFALDAPLGGETPLGSEASIGASAGTSMGASMDDGALGDFGLAPLDLDADPF